jgi:hypothetical protein
MTRSHALLHCPNDRLRAAREDAWEGKDPGSVRVLLANPRWEKRLLRFLELSGGRVVEGVDVEETRATRLDGWITWETVEREPLRGPSSLPLARPPPRPKCRRLFLLRGTHTLIPQVVRTAQR